MAKVRMVAVLAVLVSVFGASGCAEIEVSSRFAQTDALCGLDAEPLDATAYGAEPILPSAWCVDAMLADFSADTAALLDADGLHDPYAPVRGEPSLDTLVGSLIGAASAFHTVDYGVLSDLDPHDPFRIELEGVSAITGDDRIGPLAYDWVTSRITRTTTGWTGDADAGINRRTGRMVWDLRGVSAVDGVALLVHEARHRDGWRHVDCGDGSTVCDDGDDGPIGFQIGVHERLLAAADEDASVSRVERDRIVWLASRLR